MARAAAVVLAVTLVLVPATPCAPGRDGAAAAAERTADSRGAPRDTVPADSAAEPQIFMAWCAPYGMPGARSNLDFACGDTTRVDTLYLSFEIGRDGDTFTGMWMRLYFHPAFGESLGAHWDFRRAGKNPGSLLIQADPDGTFPCSQPWTRQGIGVPLYEFEPAAGRLDFIYGLREADVAPVSGRTRYCFVRLLFLHKRCGLEGAAQPICIEWQKALYSLGHGDIPITRGPSRFVSLNSPDGSVCAPYRRAVPLGRLRIGGDRLEEPGAPPRDSTGR